MKVSSNSPYVALYVNAVNRYGFKGTYPEFKKRYKAFLKLSAVSELLNPKESGHPLDTQTGVPFGDLLRQLFPTPKRVLDRTEITKYVAAMQSIGTGVNGICDGYDPYDDQGSKA